MTEKELREMKLHVRVRVDDLGSILRVIGGWIYEYAVPPGQRTTYHYVFVPETSPQMKDKTTSLMVCTRPTGCGWTGTAFACDCDADYPKEEDDGRLRCPQCGAVVKEKT